MSNVLELIKKALRDAGARRVAVMEELGCSMLEADFGDEVIISAVYGLPGRDLSLVKIVPASKAYTLLKGCEGLKYSPYGLYALIRGDVDIDKLMRKASKVLRLKDIWE